MNDEEVAISKATEWFRTQYPSARHLQITTLNVWSTGTHRLLLLNLRVDRSKATPFIVAQDLHEIEPVVRPNSRPFTISEVAHVLCNLTDEELADLVQRVSPVDTEHRDLR